MHSLPVSDRRRAIDMQPPSVPARSAASSSPVGQGARSPARRPSWRCAPAAPAPAAGWFSTPGESSLGRTHRVHNGPHTYSCTVSNPRIRVQPGMAVGQIGRARGHEGTWAGVHARILRRWEPALARPSDRCANKHAGSELPPVPGPASSLHCIRRQDKPASPRRGCSFSPKCPICARAGAVRSRSLAILRTHAGAMLRRSTNPNLTPTKLPTTCALT